MKYTEYLEIQPVMTNCFFAFSNEQFKEGIKKFNLEGQKIFNGGQGLYGTNEGITDFLNQYDKIFEDIKNNCNPQEVYDYEFINHECSYTCDDAEAFKIVVDIFGDIAASSVKRKFYNTYLSFVERGQKC